MAIKELKDTPGYVANPLEQDQTATQASQNSGDTPPPVSSGGMAPQVSSVVPGEVIRPDATQTTPDNLDTGALSGIADALSGIFGEPEVQDTETPIATPSFTENPLAQPGPAKPSILGMISPQSYGSVQKLETPVPVETVQNDRGYESVLGKILDPEPAASRPPSRTIAAHKDQTLNAQPAPETIKSVVDDYKKNPSAYRIDSSQIVDRSREVGSNWNFGTMKADSLVIHHTAGRGTSDGVIQTFKERNFPAHFVIERDGNIVQVLGLDQRGQHTKNAQDGSGITNANSWGVEIIARDDSDVTPVQVQAALKLSNYLEGHGLNKNKIVAHGAINSHKQATEGQTVIQTLAQLGG